MLEYVVDHPLWIGFFGLFIAGATFLGWIQTGNKLALGTALSAALLTILALAYSYGTESEKEKIEGMLHQTASDLEDNRFDAVYARIHRSAPELRSRAESELRRYRFSMAKVTRIKKIEIDEKHAPPMAKVEMNVVVEGSFDGFTGKAPRFVELYLYKEGSNWLVYDYSHREPMAGF